MRNNIVITVRSHEINYFKSQRVKRLFNRHLNHDRKSNCSCVFHNVVWWRVHCHSAVIHCTVRYGTAIKSTFECPIASAKDST